MITMTMVETEDQISRLAGLASRIWHEYFISILREAQIDYMVEKFQSAAAITDQLQSQGYSYFFICLDGNPVGYLGIKPDGEKLFLSKLYLQKEFRGRGYASLAFSFLEEYCRRRNLRAIWLTVNRYNFDTIHIYEKKGFVKIRQQVADIGGGFVMDDYIMEKTLSCS